MAGDTSRDPVAQAQMNRLEAELIALRQQVQTGLVASETAAAEVRGAARTVGSAPRLTVGAQAATIAEPAVIRESTAGMESLLAAAERVAQVVNQTTGGMGNLASAERVATAVAREHLTVEEQQVAAIRSAAASIGRGGPVGGAPVTPAGRALASLQAAQQAEIVAATEAQAAAAQAARTGPPGGTPGGTASTGASGPVVAPVPGPVKTTNLSEVSNLTRKQEELLRQARELAPAQRLVSAEMDHTTSAMSRSSLAYQQHGALTTEFIAAAAKGQVTIKELGNQMLLTIGKFAGWTAAAAATYGVIGVLADVGRGAKEGATGLQQLERFLNHVDTSKAQEQFRQLSATNNVSIKEAADATAAFAKIFQDQTQAVAAADIALKATQLDQISLADSTRFLTGAIVGFHLPASQLPIVFDQINNAQRRFGASVAQTLAALGGSAAAVRNAGGDFNTYIALVTAAQRASAQTGSVIGTAFRRSATSFVTKPTNQAILRSFGLDPTEAYTQLLLDAIQKAKGLTGPQINQLATGIGGPQQGARVFAALLERPDLVKRALDVTAPAKASGSAAEELAHRLQQADQQIKAVGTSLERLGSALAQTGALSPFLAILTGFKDVTDTVGNLLTLIDKLPGGIGNVLIPLAEVAAAFRLLRNLDLGARLSPTNPLAPVLGSSASNGAGLLRPSANRTAQKDFEKGLDEQTGYYRELQGNSGKASARLAAQIAAQKAYIVELTAGGAEEAEIIAEQQRLLGLQGQARAAIFQEDYYRRAIIELEVQNNERLAGIAAGMSADQAAAAAGFGSRPGALDRPTTGVPLVFGESGAAGAGAAAAAATREAEQIGLGSALMARFTAAKARLGTAFVSDAAATAAAGTATAEADVAINASIAADQQVAATVSLRSAAMRTLSVGEGVLSGSLSAIAGGLTSFTGLIIGVPILIGEINKAISAISDEAKQTAAAVASVRSPAELANQVAQLRKLADKQHNTEAGGGLPGVLGDIFSFIPGASSLESVVVKNQSPKTSALAGLGQSYLTLLKQAQADSKAVNSTAAGRQRWYAELASLEQRAKAAAAGRGPDAQKLLQSFLNSLQTIYGRAQAAAPVQSIQKNDPYAQFQTQSLDNNVKNLQALADRAKVYGSSTASLQKMAYLYEYIASSQASATDSQTLQKVASAETLYVDALKKNVQDLTDEANAITIPSVKLAGEASHAAALRQRAALLNQASALLKRGMRLLPTAYEDLAKATKLAIDNYNDAVDQLAKVQRESISIVEHLALAHGAKAQALIIQENALSGALNAARGSVSSTAAALASARAQQKAAAYANSQASAALQQQANSIAQAGQTAANQLANVPKVPKVPSSQDPFALERLRREIAKAQLDGDPVAQARSDEELARREIAVARNMHERLQGQLDLVNADNQLARAIADQAQAMYTYRASLTTDPVKIAIIDYQAAVAAVAAAERHGGANTGPALTARAKQNDARQKLIDARVQASEDTIQFDITMGKITSETAIKEYEALLKIHGLTLAKKRQILQDIKRLQDQTSNENLALGTIRLPTAYEIRRAYLAATGGQGHGQPINVTQHYSTSIQVTDTRSANQVGVVLDRHHRGTFKAIQRAIGNR